LRRNTEGRAPIRHAQILATSPADDRFATVRPVLAYCDADNMNAVKFMQLETSNEVGDALVHAAPVVGVHCAPQILVHGDRF
jgi:hypothetical protein